MTHNDGAHNEQKKKKKKNGAGTQRKNKPKRELLLKEMTEGIKVGVRSPLMEAARSINTLVA